MSKFKPVSTSIPIQLTTQQAIQKHEDVLWEVLERLNRLESLVLPLEQPASELRSQDNNKRGQD